MKKSIYALIILLVLVIGILIGIQITNIQKPAKTDINEKQLIITIPGVDSNGKGIAGTMTTTIKKGSGLILVNINDVLPGFDTQDSARIAAHVASNYTNVSLNELDIIYSIKTAAAMVSGNSAGSAFAVSTIALLENKTINSSVTITGTIESDSTIGSIGAVLEKAAASKTAKMKLMLIPKGNLDGKTEREKTCINSDKTQYCEIKYIKKINETEFGIQLKEVSDISEALKYFYNEEEK
ncbi:hypothetical protein J4404_01925 [Candidatus Woesearchaeota archaeon]|nr:hypothetical protein [Candidatus Woesearchaeota archaeon]